MKKGLLSKILTIAVIVIFFGVCCFMAPITNAANTLWALFPPVLAIGLALITKEVYSSLFIGILVGALISSGFNFAATIDNVTNVAIIDAVAGNAGIFVFLVILGIIVALVNKAGGSAAFGKWAAKNIKSKVGAALATFALGVLIFIDDYFNCLTVGSVMKPVTDTHKISRSKLAYIIDATAAPICMIAPISSWAAAVSEYADGTAYSGFELFIRAIPFNFYSILTLVFVIGLAVMNFDYGPMKKFQKLAEEGDIVGDGSTVVYETGVANKKSSVWDLVFPVIVLIISCVFGLVYLGGFFDGVSFVDAFANTPVFTALPWGGLVALIIIFIYLLIRRVITFKEAMECVPQGFIAMVPAILILTFATGLKNITTAMGAKEFVGALMADASSGLFILLPFVIFLVACALSFSTGTSWGTFGVLIPIVVAIFPAGSNLLFIGMSACLAGEVCGDHCSPISDTTIMASAGAECNHVDHVSTQLPYALTVAGISAVCFLFASLIQMVVTDFALAAVISLSFGIVLTIATLIVLKKITANK